MMVVVPEASPPGGPEASAPDMPPGDVPAVDPAFDPKPEADKFPDPSILKPPRVREVALFAAENIRPAVSE